MEAKEIILSLFPATIFFIGLLLLGYSELSLAKAVGLQNEMIELFVKTLLKADMAEALSAVADLLWTGLLLPMTPFLLMTFVSIILLLNFLKDIKLEIAVGSCLAYAGLLLLFGFSVALWLASVGMALAVFLSIKTFEPKKNIFATGHSFVSSRIGIISIFLSIGVFLTIFMNSEGYERQMQQANVELVSSFVDMSAAAEAQKQASKQFISTIADGYSSSLTLQYQSFSEGQRTQCRGMYDSLMTGLENYKQQAIGQLEAGEISAVNMGGVVAEMPVFKASAKAVSLTTAAVAYGLLSAIGFLLGLFGGIVNFLFVKLNTSGTLNKER